MENSEVVKRRASLQQRLAKPKRWVHSARERSHRAGKRHDRLHKQHKSRADELYRELGLSQTTLELQEVANHVVRREIKERKAFIDAELEQIWTKVWRAYDECNNEFRKQERYCKEQRDVLCARVNEASPQLPDGRRLCSFITSTCCILPAQEQPVT